MKKLIAVLFVATLSTSAFADTSYLCAASAQNAEISVQGSYSKTGAIQFPITVIINGEITEQFKGASAFASDQSLQIEANKNGNKLELNSFGAGDSKNFIEFTGKANGQPVSIQSKDVSCERQAN